MFSFSCAIFYRCSICGGSATTRYGVPDDPAFALALDATANVYLAASERLASIGERDPKLPARWSYLPPSEDADALLVCPYCNQEATDVATPYDSRV